MRWDHWRFSSSSLWILDWLCLEHSSFGSLIPMYPHNVCWPMCSSIFLCSPPDTVQMAADCQKKLPDGPLPQLETCLQRLPVHVCYANGKDHAVCWSLNQFQSETPVKELIIHSKCSCIHIWQKKGSTFWGKQQQELTPHPLNKHIHEYKMLNQH